MDKLAPSIAEAIHRNFEKGDLSSDKLIALLEGRVAAGARAARNKLVKELAANRHKNLRAHTKGSRDGTMHYTVFVRGKGYHLQVDRRGVIFRITDKSAASITGQEPWVRPGG